MAQYHFDLGINSYILDFKTRHLVYFADDKRLKTKLWKVDHVRHHIPTLMMAYHWE